MAENDPQLTLNEPAPVPAATPASAAVTPAQAPDARPVNPNSPKWALERISEETNGRRQAVERAEKAETELANARELLARLQSQPQPQAQPQPQPQPQRQPIPFQQPQGNDDQRIQDAARQQRFLEDINEARSRGFSEFGTGLDGFQGTINTIAAVGIGNDVLADVLAVDRANAHKIFHKIAQDPDGARALTHMTSPQRIAHFTRMTMADQPKTDPNPAPQPAKTSAAPEPRPASQGVAALPADTLADDVDDAQWSKNWDAKYSPRRRSA